MAYTLRQVQALLTKPETELFQASRPEGLKALSARQLSGKVTRARALRDKYRDVYRRQTVKTRTDAASTRKPMGEENNRTEIKAEVMGEVLARFEAQQDKLAQREAKASKAASGKTAAVAPVKKMAAKKAVPVKAAAKKVAAKKVAAKSPTPKAAAKKAAAKV